MKKRLKSEHAAPAAEEVQRKCAACAEGGTAGPSAEGALRSLAGGSPLSAADRAYFEPRFGHDLGAVRVVEDAPPIAPPRRSGHARSLSATGSPSRAANAAPARRRVAHSSRTSWPMSCSRAVPGTCSRKCAACEAEDTTLRRKPVPSPLSGLLGDDPIHAPLIEDYRRRHGLPPGGVDESGERRGPSDAEIKYVLGPGQWLPPCPDVEPAPKDIDFRNPAHKRAFRDTNCVSPDSQAMPPACGFSPLQERLLEGAQGEASRRVKRALDRVTLAGKEGEDYAQDLAKRVFTGEAPTIKETVRLAHRRLEFPRRRGVDFAGRTCGDAACQQFATKAYVKGPGQLPVYICPLSFAYPTELSRTVLHEALHWAGLDADPTTPEGYCEKFDCFSPCQDKETGGRLGALPRLPGPAAGKRRSFVDKIVESVEEIP